MPTVYVRESRFDQAKFHRTPDCSQLKKAPAKGVNHELLAVDLAELPQPTPCLFCYPDAPRPRSIHRWCEVCNRGKVRPCAHNGGVLVHIPTPVYAPKVHVLRGPQTYAITRYVWPEKVRKYMTLAS